MNILPIQLMPDTIAPLPTLAPNDRVIEAESRKTIVQQAPTHKITPENNHGTH